MIKGKIFLVLVFFGLIFSLLSVSKVSAVATCTVVASVSGNSVTVTGTVRESRPGLDPSDVFMSMFDDAGGPGLTASAHDDSLTRSYTFTAPNGEYTARINGESISNPGNEYSTCSDFDRFTVGEITPPRTLYVYKEGSGNVYSSPEGIDCGGDCQANYDHGTSVTLNAYPSSGSTFTGWGGACSGSGSCTVYMDGDKSVTAYFGTAAPLPFIIGSGGCYDWPNPKIENNPTVGPDHNDSYRYSLYRRNINYGGWETIADHWEIYYIDVYGDPVSQYGEYEYQVEAFNSGGSRLSDNTAYYYAGPSQCGQVLNTLNVDVSPTGGGTVTGPGISCPGDCSQQFDQTEGVTITATPSTGYTFSGWTGACPSQPASCYLSMSQARSTTANFSANSYNLTVAYGGNGSGTVTPSPVGTSCGSNCYTYQYGQSVTLTRNPSPGSDFSGWSGACSGVPASNNCTLTMDSAKSVTASFSANLYSISVGVNGSGTVTGTGISCPGDCGENFTYNTPVSITANDSSSASFSSWSGACAGQGRTCNLTMDGSKSTTANFTANFNYSLSTSGNSNVTKQSGNAYTTNNVSATLIAGATQPVTVTSVTGQPSGVSYSVSSNPCSPNCSYVITFTVPPTTPVGTYPITVTASPLSKTTNFNLIIVGAPFSVSCVGAPQTVFLNENVTWTATINGGKSPFTYTWSGSGIPTSPAPSTNPYSRTYSTIGLKSTQVTVRDADSVLATCPAATVQVNFDPNFEEF